MTVHARSVGAFLYDVAFFAACFKPSSWRAYELHERTCALFFNGGECTCARTGGAA